MIKAEISQYLSLHNSIAQLHFLIMASNNKEALHGHMTEVNHWTITVSHESLLACYSIMAQINSSLGGFPLSQTWHIWISATEGTRACVMNQQWRINLSGIHLQNIPKMKSARYLTTLLPLQERGNHQKPWKQFEQMIPIHSENNRYNQTRALLNPPPHPPPPVRSLCWE